MRTFRNVALSSIVLLCSPFVQAQSWTDTFSGTTLNTSIWKYQGSPTYTVNNGLTITDFDGSWMGSGAPLSGGLTADAPGGDWMATMKVGINNFTQPNVDPGNWGNPPMIGIMATSADGNSIVSMNYQFSDPNDGMFSPYPSSINTGLVAVASQTPGSISWSGDWILGSGGIAGSSWARNWSDPSAPFWLRISKSGDTYSLSASTDGAIFAPVATTTYNGSGNNALSRIGIYAGIDMEGNASATIDSFAVVPEPVFAPVALSACGLAILRRRRDK